MTIDTAKMASLITEQRNPLSMNIDRLSAKDILQTIHKEDQKALDAIDSALEDIERVVEFVVHAFKHGGRLFYVGAGTSGRLGVLDASECPPTFGVSPDMVQGIIAGGWDALRMAVERAEDYPEHGAQAVQDRGVTDNDVLVGIAASSRTPFVIGALQKAHEIGAKTALISCNPNQASIPEADAAITLVVGPEVITGSTRMKAGTATKLVLNMITTTAMIRIGKVYENLMVDLKATNQKLDDRSRRIVSIIAQCSHEEADRLMREADGHVKTALVMRLAQTDKENALKLLEKHDGKIHDILAAAP